MAYILPTELVKRVSVWSALCLITVLTGLRMLPFWHLPPECCFNFNLLLKIMELRLVNFFFLSSLWHVGEDWSHLKDYEFLTHWSWDKMATNLQTTYFNALYSMKKFLLRLKFHYSLFLKAHLTMIHNCFISKLDAEYATSNYLNQ